KIGPDPRNFNQRVSLGRNDLLIRTFLSTTGCKIKKASPSIVTFFMMSVRSPPPAIIGKNIAKRPGRDASAFREDNIICLVSSKVNLLKRNADIVFPLHVVGSIVAC
ncbi:hypothetical protein M8453_26155, partial [Citrobacter freundii]|nr:hypothetical protein [Citrobacter freundii]MCR3718017.1 hypothetical protein [Citrobacter freundii]